MTAKPIGLSQNPDDYITWDLASACWCFSVPQPYGLAPTTGRCDFIGEARATVLDLIRDPGPAKIIEARAPWATDGHRIA